jgi:hypothetical protein
MAAAAAINESPSDRHGTLLRVVTRIWVMVLFSGPKVLATTTAWLLLFALRAPWYRRSRMLTRSRTRARFLDGRRRARNLSSGYHVDGFGD